MCAWGWQCWCVYVTFDVAFTHLSPVAMSYCGFAVVCMYFHTDWCMTTQLLSEQGLDVIFCYSLGVNQHKQASCRFTNLVNVKQAAGHNNIAKTVILVGYI